MSEVKNNFVMLSQINVNDKTEKKANKFTYLSWAFAVEEIMKADPNANWVIHEPKYYGQQVMVSCTLTAFDKPVYMWLPVMNHANQPINNPSVNDINKAQMRCLVKAIACHGLGLYIYAGEDLPSDDDIHNTPVAQALIQQGAQIKQTLTDERFAGALASVKNGSYDKMQLLNNFSLTDAQRAQVAAL